jgi:hypothetical protein
MSNENKNDATDSDQVSQKPRGVGYSGLQSGQSGQEGGRRESLSSHQSDSRGQVREASAELRDSIRDRYQSRIPGTRVVDPSDTLLKAFLDGCFETAHQAALDLKEAYHEALTEAARQRYRVNFGTEACNNCDGLKAGPGVVATCFQVQKCNFDSIHEGSENSHHLGVINRLSLK